jgi:hypothetical protein
MDAYSTVDCDLVDYTSLYDARFERQDVEWWALRSGSRRYGRIESIGKSSNILLCRHFHQIMSSHTTMSGKHSPYTLHNSL